MLGSFRAFPKGQTLVCWGLLQANSRLFSRCAGSVESMEPGSEELGGDESWARCAITAKYYANMIEAIWLVQLDLTHLRIFQHRINTLKLRIVPKLVLFINQYKTPQVLHVGLVRELSTHSWALLDLFTQIILSTLSALDDNLLATVMGQAFVCFRRSRSRVLRYFLGNVFFEDLFTF